MGNHVVYVGKMMKTWSCSHAGFVFMLGQLFPSCLGLLYFISWDTYMEFDPMNHLRQYYDTDLGSMQDHNQC